MSFRADNGNRIKLNTQAVKAGEPDHTRLQNIVWILSV
jgi:hypothetical protein